MSRRFQCDLDDEDLERLDSLVGGPDGATRAEVIRTLIRRNVELHELVNTQGRALVTRIGHGFMIVQKEDGS